MRSLSRITNNIILCNQETASDVKLLVKNEISYVLTTSDRLLLPQTLENFSKHDITHEHVHFAEDDYTQAQLRTILDSIAMKINRHEKSQKLVVHCVKGQNRSAAAVLYWMIVCRGMAFKTALKTLQRKRHVYIDPTWLKMIKSMEGQTQT